MGVPACCATDFCDVHAYCSAERLNRKGRQAGRQVPDGWRSRWSKAQTGRRKRLVNSTSFNWSQQRWKAWCLKTVVPNASRPKSTNQPTHPSRKASRRQQPPNPPASQENKPIDRQTQLLSSGGSQRHSATAASRRTALLLVASERSLRSVWVGVEEGQDRYSTVQYSTVGVCWGRTSRLALRGHHGRV